jgi:hypothetical protein
VADIFVIVYPTPQHNILAPRYLYYGGLDSAGLPAVQPETNTHFVGKFSAPTFRRLPYFHGDSSQSGPLPPQIEAPAHFLGRFQPAKITSLLGYRQNPATDLVAQPETNTHFVGRLTPPRFGRLPYFHGDTSQSGPLPPQPETNVHFVGRLRVTPFYLLRKLWQQEPNDIRTQPPPATAPVTQSLRLLSSRSPNVLAASAQRLKLLPGRPGS